VPSIHAELDRHRRHLSCHQVPSELRHREDQESGSAAWSRRHGEYVTNQASKRASIHADADSRFAYRRLPADIQQQILDLYDATSIEAIASLPHHHQHHHHHHHPPHAHQPSSSVPPTPSTTTTSSSSSSSSSAAAAAAAMVRLLLVVDTFQEHASHFSLLGTVWLMDISDTNLLLLLARAVAQASRLQALPLHSTPTTRNHRRHRHQSHRRPRQLHRPHHCHRRLLRVEQVLLHRRAAANHHTIGTKAPRTLPRRRVAAKETATRTRTEVAEPTTTSARIGQTERAAARTLEVAAAVVAAFPSITVDRVRRSKQASTQASKHIQVCLQSQQCASRTCVSCISRVVRHRDERSSKDTRGSGRHNHSSSSYSRDRGGGAGSGSGSSSGGGVGGGSSSGTGGSSSSLRHSGEKDKYDRGGHRNDRDSMRGSGGDERGHSSRRDNRHAPY